MIFGNGIDIVYIPRIAKLYNKVGDKFAMRILTEHEYQLFCNRAKSINFLAKRFAAKEAFAKAFKTGIGKQLAFSDLTVLKNEDGSPFFMVTEKLRVYLTKKQIKKSHLSISDDGDYAIAQVILELA